MTSTDIGYLLNKATRRFRLDFAERLAPTGLRPQQAAALMALGRSPEGHLTPGQLAEAIDADAPTISGLLDRLARDGWAQSAPNPDDRRTRIVSLTEKGRAALPVVFEAAGDTSAAAVCCLTPDEVRTLEELLSRLCEHAHDEDGAAR